MTSKSQSQQADPGVPFSWLTIEITLWGLLLIAALGLRLLHLDRAPLNAVEARNALAAWGFSHGQGAPAASDYSPLLFSSQWLTFLIFGANDLVARLWPALAGTALVLTPALLRPQLGRLGALATATLLTLSPTALMLSRTASGDILVALGTMLCVSGFWRYLDCFPPEKHAPTYSVSRLVSLCAFGGALMLVSSPLAYSALLGVGSALLLAALIDPDSRELLQRGWAGLRATPNFAYSGLGVLLGSIVLLSTAFAWHFAGLAATADLVSQWLDGFVRWPDSLSINYPGLILVFYELLILLTGCVGAAVAIARGRPFSRFLALWSILALLLALVRPGRGPTDVLLILLPLACLGGTVLESLIEGLRHRGHWLNEGMYLGITLPLWGYLLINLATYSRRSDQYSQIRLALINISFPTFLSIAVVAAVLLLLLAAAMASMQGPRPALRGFGVSAIIALLLFSIATAWGVSQNRPADPRELLVLEPTAPEVRLLRESLSRVSSEHKGDAHAIDLTILTDDPVVHWALRDFRQALVAEPSETPALTSAVVAPQTLGTPSLGSDYVGQSFPLRRRWEINGLFCHWNLVQLDFDQVTQLDCSALAEWILFRHTAQPPMEEHVVLWLRQDLIGW
jgi:uncharacterized protein (TIGR03663 family)